MPAMDGLVRMTSLSRLGRLIALSLLGHDDGFKDQTHCDPGLKP